ncbi:hypothetical protein J2792_002334 [Novosphingobium capsulatum]|uniref:Phage tail tube protein n=1 Tax=Novosphingobium capsulatum TaxID=13688 RepID=A0ABU1MNG0_9SPHN|nr:hypothetical protein [Novosphingobium capsulatum]MDR6511462.1 hypothetical protein [Novosphingobium capsulatum]
MPQQGYTIGRDVSVVVTLPNGTNLPLGKVTSFESKPDTTKTKVKGLDGVVDNLRFWEGWTGTIKTERRNADLDNYFAGLEAAYWAGQSEDYCTIQETIAENNGTVTQFRYERVIFDYDAGTYESDKTVSQTLSFTAAKRIKQA